MINVFPASYNNSVLKKDLFMYCCHFLLKLMLFLLLSAASFNLSAETITNCGNKQVIGNHAAVFFENEHIMLKAKLDTGAAMSSLCAEHIKIYKQDNKQFVTFSVCGVSGNIKITKELNKYVKIRARAEEKSIFVERPVILMTVKVGNQIQTIPINLTNRSHFMYPMLLGRDALIKFNVLVDPSR